MADKWETNGESGRIDPFVEIYDVSVSFWDCVLQVTC